MTLPYEQVSALKKTEAFLKELLRDLLVGKISAKRRDEIRTKAYWCLRHYPCDIQIESYWMGGEWEKGVWPPLKKMKKEETSDDRPRKAVHRVLRPNRSPHKG